jgi:hypothetical protein
MKFYSIFNEKELTSRGSTRKIKISALPAKEKC